MSINNTLDDAATEAATTAFNFPTLKPRKASLKADAAKAVADAGVPSSDPLELGELKSARLEEIDATDRARKVVGDIEVLMRSMRESGLANPLLVDRQMRLVCGSRRLEAARRLGWEEIPVRVLDIEDPLALMVAEDAVRKDLTASEKFAIFGVLHKRAKAKGWRKTAFGGRLDVASEKGRLDEEIAKALKLSRESLRKIRAIHEAAATDPNRYGDLVEALDADGRVDKHHRELMKRQGRGEVDRAAAVVVSPGWEALIPDAEPRDLARFVKGCLLAVGSDEGTAILFPSRVETLAVAAGLMRQGGFDWEATLRGSGVPGEDLWLVGVQGKKNEIPTEARELIAEGCLEGAETVVRSAEAAFEGEVRSLDLMQTVPA